ncbi:hypothetical protein ACLK1S_20920 [Escherichia coli]
MHPTAFIWINIQETHLAGHAEDVARYAEMFAGRSRNLARLLRRCSQIIAWSRWRITVTIPDHRATAHHTREVVPVLVYQQGLVQHATRCTHHAF